MDHSGLFNFLSFMLLVMKLFKFSMIHLVYRIVIFEILFDNAAISRILTPCNPCQRISRRYFSGHHTMLSILGDTAARAIRLIASGIPSASLHKVTHHFIIELFLLKYFVRVVILCFGESPP
jgi:hypothetical protein